MPRDQHGRQDVSTAPLRPAEPLWRLAPTHDNDGRCLADFMMLIPGLGGRPDAAQALVCAAVRDVCEDYGDQVSFAEINFNINVLWISVAAVPGLAGRVAQSIRERVPDALLVGGQLGSGMAMTAAGPSASALWRRLRRLRQLPRDLTRRLVRTDPPGLPGGDS